MLVAVAYGGGINRAAYSADGNTWTRATCPSGDWRRVNSNGVSFLAVGPSSAMVSPNGITWTSGSIPSGAWRGLCATPAGWLAVAERGTANRAAISPNGTSWTVTGIPSGDWRGCAHGGGITVAVEGYSPGFPSTRVAYSTDSGSTWSTTTCPSGEWMSVARSPTRGLFVAVANSGTWRVMTSPDGITWTGRTMPSPGSWRDVVWDGARFVAVSYSGQIALSTDGITWTIPTVLGGWQLTGVAAAPASAALCAESGGARLALSADGITWNAPTSPVTDTWHDIAGTWVPPPPAGWSVGFLKF